MPFRQISLPSLGRALSNIMACPTSGEPDSHDAGLDEFYRLGGNCIHLHGEGGETHSRRATGTWLRRHELRPKFFLCTQICHEGWDAAAERAIGRCTPDAVAEDIGTDLDLLGTDYVDFVYLANHPTGPVEPVIEALAREVARGHIRAFGVRNWSAERIWSANAHAVRIGASGVAAVVTTELALPCSARPLWPEDIPFAQIEPTVLDLGLPVFAHADGFNQATHLFDDEKKAIHPRWVERWNHPANAEIVKRVRAFADARGIEPTEVNLAWLLNRAFPSVAMIGLPELLANGGARLESASQLILNEAERSTLRPPI